MLVSCTLEAQGQEILAILNEAIENSVAIYDYRPRSIDSMRSWFAAKEAPAYPVLGLVDESGSLCGFASYGSFRSWPAYKYTVEHCVYIHRDHRGQGIGTRLLEALIARAREQEYHLMIGGLDVENTGSIALHRKFGFRHAGTIAQAAYKFGRWLDLAFYQLILDTPRQPVED